VAALSVIIRAACPMAVVGKELEHEIEQLHRSVDFNLGMVLTAPDPNNRLSLSPRALNPSMMPGWRSPKPPLPGPYTRANSRLLAVGGQNRARRGLTGGGNGIRTLGPPVPGGRLERAQRTEDGRWAVRMRNPKPEAKESRLYDHASTAISGARIYSTGSVEARER
jgi:hypothetical protein